MFDSGKLTKQLCLECGMCCNGVLFRDVELQPGDTAKKLRELGLPVKDTPARRNSTSKPTTNTAAANKQRFPQPCAALCADNRCQIYADRPSRCREFECALLKAASAGRIEPSQALRHIRSAQRRVDAVVRLLRALGDQSEHLPLSRRFRNTRRRVESHPLDDDTADLYGKLTLAVHDLNLLLAQEFYPGRTE
jgi:uncharacterized protein